MIDSQEKIVRNRPLYGMFTAIPRHYDLVNHVITWGFDSRWRRQAARKCLASHPGKILDLCCGTGDLIINLARLADNRVQLAAVDYSRLMLELAIKKNDSLARRRGLAFICGDAAHLPFPDGHFDCVGISFAFRNLTYKNPLIHRYLAEILRVLGSGGRFVIVETSQPRSKLTRKLFHLYLRWYVSRVGSLISGNSGAYHYLAESATRFYSPDELRELLLTAGFRRMSFRPLFWGAIGLYVAVK
ncbi:ubiquinone/menaquinone biosynthesis methyltransferase [Chloroflexota bacterium]